MFEISEGDASNRKLYLAFCSRKTVFPSPQVRYVPEEGVIRSDAYEYHFDTSNYMLFRSVHAADPRRVVAKRSSIDLLANLKKFFSLHFGATDIESKLGHVEQGPVGVHALVTFYLKVFFFRVKLALSMDVSFYRDSAHIPMVLYFPADPREHLNVGSGIFYHWGLPEMHVEARAPRLGVVRGAIEKEDLPALARYGSTFCRRDGICSFGMSGQQDGGKSIDLQLSIGRSMVDRGFFPILVRPADELEEALGWNFGASNDPSRVGFYFETSGLGPGRHLWDFWMRVAPGPGRSLPESTCPKALGTITERAI